MQQRTCGGRLCGGRLCGGPLWENSIEKIPKQNHLLTLHCRDIFSSHYKLLTWTKVVSGRKINAFFPDSSKLKVYILRDWENTDNKWIWAVFWWPDLQLKLIRLNALVSGRVRCQSWSIMIELKEAGKRMEKQLTIFCRQQTIKAQHISQFTQYMNLPNPGLTDYMAVQMQKSNFFIKGDHKRWRAIFWCTKPSRFIPISFVIRIIFHILESISKNPEANT